jgi:hypothetical protein
MTSFQQVVDLRYASLGYTDTPNYGGDDYSYIGGYSGTDDQLDSVLDRIVGVYGGDDDVELTPNTLMAYYESDRSYVYTTDDMDNSSEPTDEASSLIVEVQPRENTTTGSAELVKFSNVREFIEKYAKSINIKNF